MESNDVQNHDIQLQELVISTKDERHGTGTEFSLFGLRNTLALLRTAIPLTEEDQAIAESNISYAQSEGGLIDQEILHIQNSLEKLLSGADSSVTIAQERTCVELSLEMTHNRRNVLRQFEELERGLLSPIRKLPLEILEKIFILAHEKGYMSSNDLKAFPRVASRVCSFWRSVSHSCAQLWTDISCTDTTHALVYNPKYGILLEECIQFSKERVLSLTIGLPPQILGLSCIKALARSAYRWKYINIMDGELVKVIFFFLPEDSSFENLEAMVLYIWDSVSIIAAPKLTYLEISSDGKPGAHITIQSAPSLTHIHLDRIYLPSVALSGVDWSKITHFDALDMYFQPEEFNIVLERMQNLISLSLEGGNGSTTILTLPYLETLSIDRPDGEDIFDILITPRLKKLIIRWDFDVSSTSIVEFVRRSGCVLEELKLEPTLISEVWLSPEFASVKKLHWDASVYLSSLSNSTQLLTFEISPSDNDLFPGLEILHMTCDCLRGGYTRYGDVVSTLTPLVDMLKSRLGRKETESTTRKYLKSIDMYFVCFYGDEEHLILSQFVNSELVKSSGVRMAIRDPWGKLQFATPE